jgi:hypothetical protein
MAVYPDAVSYSASMLHIFKALSANPDGVLSYGAEPMPWLSTVIISNRLRLPENV